MPLVPPILASAVDVEPYTSIMALDPVAYWRLNEASGDLTNHGSLASKDAVANGTPAYQNESIVPRSPEATVLFDGSTDYFQVTDAVITGTDPNFSMGCWIKTDAGLSATTIFQQQDTTSAYCGFRLYTNSGVIIFQSHHTDGTSQTMTIYGLNAFIQDNSLLYLGITADDDNFYAYVNGERFVTLARSTVEYVSGSDCFIGRAEGAFRYFDGHISDLFIVDFPMTHAQHLEIWRKGEYQLDRPKGDNFKDAVALAVDTEVVGLTTVGASENPDTDPINYFGAIDLHKNIWHRFVPADAVNDRYIVRVTSDGTSRPTVHVYYGPADAEDPTDLTKNDHFSILNELNEGADLLDPTSYTPEAGDVYWICVGLQGSYTMTPGTYDLVVESFPDPPANDDFVDAETIDVSVAGSLTASTTGSTIENSQECVRTNCNEHSVWYKFTADATGSITLSLGDTPNYLYYGIAAWDATADGISVVGDVDWTTPLAYDDNDATGNGEITISVTSGNVYYFHVTQGDTLSDADFELTWTDIT